MYCPNCQCEINRTNVHGTVCPRCSEVILPAEKSPLTQMLDADAEALKDLVRQYMKQKIGASNANRNR